MEPYSNIFAKPFPYPSNSHEPDNHPHTKYRYAKTPVSENTVTSQTDTKDPNVQNNNYKDARIVGYTHPTPAPGVGQETEGAALRMWIPLHDGMR